MDAPNSILSVQQATLAYYYVAGWTAKQKPHTVGKDLVKPAATDMMRITCGDEDS
jgi:hypothetical protein